MSNSPNMGMPIPVVGVTSGPTWAQNIVDSLNIIDSHTHAVGSGAPVDVVIGADLTFNSFSATSLKSVKFTSQSAALSGNNFLSFTGGNLYVNDGSGNSIQITSGGSIVAGGGSITGSFTGGAGVSYSGNTYTFLSGTLKAGALDNGAVTIRETNVSSAKGITLKSPTSLAADYNLTLPTGLPGSTQVLQTDSSGNMGTISYDSIGSGMSSTGANAIAASRTRATGTTVAAGGIGISNSSGAFTTSSTSFVDVTNLSVTITTSGRPVFIGLLPTSSGSAVYSSNTSSSTESFFQFVRGSTALANSIVFMSATGTSFTQSAVPPGSLFYIDAVAAGTYTYKLQAMVVVGSTAGVSSCQLVVYEL